MHFPACRSAPTSMQPQAAAAFKRPKVQLVVAAGEVCPDRRAENCKRCSWLWIQGSDQAGSMRPLPNKQAKMSRIATIAGSSCSNQALTAMLAKTVFLSLHLLPSMDRRMPCVMSKPCTQQGPFHTWQIELQLRLISKIPPDHL